MQHDIVVCSAFKNSYSPVAKSFIGELLYKANISVHLLSQNPEIDLKSYGCWISKKLEGNIKRIACVELLEAKDKQSSRMDDDVDVLIKSSFSTLYFLLEQAVIKGITINSIALPLIGTGYQGVNLKYIANPLVTYSVRALQNIDMLNEIILYETDENKASEVVGIVSELFAETAKQHEDIFISYCTKQQSIAENVYSYLTEEGYLCWMAPNSIPIGSSYLEEIPKALNDIKVLLLILTTDAMVSPWVRKEVASSAGANKLILPIKIGEFEINEAFKFLLTDVQIYSCPKHSINKNDLISFLENYQAML